MIGSKELFLKDLEFHIRSLFISEGTGQLVFHHYALTKSLQDEIETLAKKNGIEDSTSLELLRISAWFYFTGYLFDYQQPAEQSINQARKYLEGKKLPPEKTGAVILLLRSAWKAHAFETELERTLHDGAQIVELIKDFAQLHPLRKLEIEWMSGQKYSELEWTRYQLQELLQVKLLTKGGKEFWEPVLAQNILAQTQRLEKMIRKSGSEGMTISTQTPFQLEGNVGIRAVQTFFRANYRNHINLSAIADNKANIMISVNAILISVLISILSYRNLTEANPMIMMPAIIFLVTGLTSLIFAVLSARPKVTSLTGNQKDIDKIRKNLVFFGNYVQLDLDEYEAEMDRLFKDGKLLLANMTRDMYYLGKVLEKKYRFLTISYNVFMMGFVATVFTFFIVFFTS